MSAVRPPRAGVADATERECEVQGSPVLVYTFGISPGTDGASHHDSGNKNR